MIYVVALEGILDVVVAAATVLVMRLAFLGGGRPLGRLGSGVGVLERQQWRKGHTFQQLLADWLCPLGVDWKGNHCQAATHSAAALCLMYVPAWQTLPFATADEW